MAAVKLSEIRAKYPMYSDMSDDQLLISLHRKLYPDLTPQQFYGNVEYDTERASVTTISRPQPRMNAWTAS
jgi:hypothetical protein